MAAATNTVRWWMTGALLAAGSGARAAPQAMQADYDIHLLTLWLVAALMAVVTALVARAALFTRRDPAPHYRETRLGRWGWVAVPALVLGVDLLIAATTRPPFNPPLEAVNEVALMNAPAQSGRLPP